VAVEIEPMLAAEAKERQRESTSKAGKASAAKRQGNAVEIVPPRSDAGKARDQAARLTCTNRQYVSDAKAVKAKAPDRTSACVTRRLGTGLRQGCLVLRASEVGRKTSGPFVRSARQRG
jgi:hypothetical protein